MKFKELLEYEDNCKDHCPLYNEFCAGGMACYGGAPVEPYCVVHDIDPEQDMEELYAEICDKRTAWERKEEEKILVEKNIQEKKYESQRKRRIALSLVRDENKLIKACKKSKQNYLKKRQWAQSQDNVHAMMNRQPLPAPKEYYAKEINDLEQIIMQTEEIKKLKLKNHRKHSR